MRFDCRWSLHIGFWLFMLLACPFALADDGEDSILDEWRESAERINLLIDAIVNDEERMSQRERVANITNAIYRRQLANAYQVALTTSLHGPSAEVRAEWAALASQWKVHVEASETAVTNHEERFHTQLQKIWTFDSAIEIEHLLAILDDLPRDHDLHKNHEMIRGRKAALSWQAMLDAIQDESYLEALQFVGDTRSTRIVPEEALQTASDEILRHLKGPVEQLATDLIQRISAGEDEQVDAIIDDLHAQELYLAASRFRSEFPEIAEIGQFAVDWIRIRQLREMQNYPELLAMLERRLAVDRQADLQERLARLHADVEDEFRQLFEAHKAEVIQFVVNPPNDGAWLSDVKRKKYENWSRGNHRDERFVAFRNLYEAVYKWNRIRSALKQGDRTEASRFLDDLERTNPGVFSEDQVAGLRAELSRDLPSPESWLKESQKRIAASTTLAEALSTETWMLEQFRLLSNLDGEQRRTGEFMLAAAERWREYLEAKDHGHHHTAHDRLDELWRMVRAESSDRRWLEPSWRDAKSELAAAEQPLLESIDEAAADARNGDGLAALQTAIASAVKHGFAKDVRSELHEFQQDVEILAALESGVALLGRAELSNAIFRRSRLKPHRWTSFTRHYEASLLLNKFAETGQLGWLELQEDEGFRELLLRSADEASKQQQWRRLHQILAVYRSLIVTSRERFPSEYSQLSSDILVLDRFCRANSLKQAGEFALARREYELALRRRSERVPKATIELGLNALPE